MSTKITARCSNDRKDSYFPAMNFTCRLVVGEDQFIYEYKHLEDLQGFALTKASASNMQMEAQMRKVAFTKMQAYYDSKLKQYQKECDAGVWN